MHLKKVHGIEVPEEARLTIDLKYLPAIRAIDALLKTHPPQPLFTIPTMDSVLICRLNGLDVAYYCTDVIPNLVYELNKKLSEKNEPAKLQTKEWEQ